MQVKNPTDPASFAQVTFINDLLTSREVEDKWITVVKHRLEAGITKGEASKIIEWFQRQPKAGVKADKVLANGVYETHSGAVYAVKVSKTSGKPYAMIWDASRSTYLYDRNHYRTLLANNPAPLSLAQAAVMGIDSGFCVICGQHLTDVESLAKGIGPVCEKRQSALVGGAS